MTTQELIDSTKKLIHFDDAKFNITSKQLGDNHIWAIELSIQNIIIIMKAEVNHTKSDEDPKSTICLAYKHDNFSNEGKVINIPIQNYPIEYIVYQDLITSINKIMTRTEDDVHQDIKSILRENTLTNILN